MPTRTTRTQNAISYGVALLVAALLTASYGHTESPPQLKLGAILSFTGVIAPVGNSMRQGMELALSEPDMKNVQVIFEDDQSVDRITSVNATTKLATVDHCDGLLVEAVSAVSAIAPIVTREKIPTVVVWDSNDSLKTAGQFVYGFGFSNELAGEHMADYAFSKLNAKSFGLVMMQNDWSELVGAAFRREIKKLGGKLVAEETVTPQTVDFRSLILRLKQANVEAVYFPLFGTGMHTFIRQARELKFEGDLFTGDGMSDTDVAMLGLPAEGVYVGQVWFEDKSFGEKYAKKFGAPANSGVNLGYAALGYDALKMFGAIRERLVEKNIAISRESIQEQLKTFHYKGILGEATFTETHASNRGEHILQVRNGKFELAE